MKDISDIEVGKAAEHLVVADLILQGHRAYLTDQGLPYDVVVDVDGRLLRIQVKSTRYQRPVAQRKTFTPGYIFHTRKAGKQGRRQYAATEFDLIAFVALDVRVIAYMPFAAVSSNMIILRPLAYVPAPHAQRRENIDGFPFSKALADLGASNILTLARSTAKTA